MSYTKVKSISVKKDKITISGASNNCHPITYSTFEYRGNTKDLILNILSGDLQLNDGVYKWNYAFYKMEEELGIEKYRELKEDIDNWKWDFNDVKRIYVLGSRDYLPTKYITLSQEEYNSKQNELIEIDKSSEKSNYKYVLYMEKEQYNELQDKFNKAIDIMHDLILKYLNEKDTEKEYTIYGDGLGYIKKTKSNLQYSNGYVLEKDTYKKIYCKFKQILKENVERYNIRVEQVIDKQEKITTNNGYSGYKVAYRDILNWGGYGVCDHCNSDMKLGGYLVYVLNSCVCPSCFNEWQKDSKLYKEDLELDKQNSEEWYNNHLKKEKIY